MTGPSRREFLGEWRNCDCGHPRGAHRRRGTGPCTGLDSYGVPCGCPWMEVEPQSDGHVPTDPDTNRDGASWWCQGCHTTCASHNLCDCCTERDAVPEGGP